MVEVLVSTENMLNSYFIVELYIKNSANLLLNLLSFDTSNISFFLDSVIQTAISNLSKSYLNLS